MGLFASIKKRYFHDLSDPWSWKWLTGPARGQQMKPWSDSFLETGRGVCFVSEKGAEK